MKATINPDDIIRALRLFSTPDSLIEIRALNCSDHNPEFTCARIGYFDHDHLNEAAQAAIELETTWHASGVYITLNPIPSDLLARSANRIRKAQKNESTKDVEILTRRWMLVDFDPIRPKGISSSADELQAAQELARVVGIWLCDHGFPRPVIAMSGNGFHLLFRIDLPTADGGLVEQCLQSLDQHFSTAAVGIDTGVYNPARITKCYGTMTRKGDSTEARPNRRSELIEVPETIETVPQERLEWLARQYVEPEKPSHTPSTNGSSDRLDVESYLARHQVEILNRDTTADGAARWFISCPNESVHTTKTNPRDCCVTQAHTGALGGKCFHSSCGIRDWQSIKSAIGPITGEDYPKSSTGAADKSTPGEETTNKPPATKAIKIRTAGELIREFPELRPELVNGLLRSGETMNIIAQSKFGKSWLMLALALCVACGRKWLGKFWTKRGRVLYIDNELHPETFSNRLPKVAESLGLVRDEWDSTLCVMNLRGELLDLHQLSLQLLDLRPGAFDLIVLDAWYRLQPSGSDENANGDVMKLYNLLDSVAARIGSAFVCVHHSSKGNQSGKAVTDVGSGAGAQSRAADTHLVLRAHEADNAVVVEAAVRSWAPMPPFCMRFEFPQWTLADDLDPKDLRTERPRKKAAATESGELLEDVRQQKEQAARLKVLEAYEVTPDGNTESKLSAAAGMNSRTFAPIHADLLRKRLAVACTVKKNNGASYDGFKLTEAGFGELRQLRQLRQNEGVSDLSDTTPTTALSLESGVCRSVVSESEKSDRKLSDFETEQIDEQSQATDALDWTSAGRSRRSTQTSEKGTS